MYSPMHFAQNCPNLSTEYPTEEVKTFNKYRKPTSGPFPETYNPGWRNHPNFSWKQNQPLNQGGISTQAQNQYRPSHQAQVQQPAPKSSLEDTLQALIQASSQTMEELKEVTMTNSRDIQEPKSYTTQAVTDRRANWPAS
jgi:hypothetical protein